MRFFGPLKSHERAAKTNPKVTLIIDIIFLVITTSLLILFSILIISNYGFDVLLILPWILLGGIIIWLISLMVTSIKSLKKKEKSKQNK